MSGKPTSGKGPAQSLGAASGPAPHPVTARCLSSGQTTRGTRFGCGLGRGAGLKPRITCKPPHQGGPLPGPWPALSARAARVCPQAADG